MVRDRLMTIAALAISLQLTASFAVAQSVDFETYRTKVEPIFLKKRVGHARCIACHEASNSAFRLQPLAAGSSTWTEEQSRRNFENASRLVTPGNPEKSKLLIHPLAQEAGGDLFHSGGRQFASKDDPEWKIIAAWVKQAK
jgi:hypothetical protein